VPGRQASNCAPRGGICPNRERVRQRANGRVVRRTLLPPLIVLPTRPAVCSLPAKLGCHGGLSLEPGVLHRYAGWRLKGVGGMDGTRTILETTTEELRGACFLFFMSGLERAEKCTEVQPEQFKNTILGTFWAHVFGSDSAS